MAEPQGRESIERLEAARETCAKSGNVKLNYAPLKLAGRFCRKARTPSLKSAEAPALRCI